MMIHFCPKNIFLPRKKVQIKKKMLECIKFGNCKIKTVKIEDGWFVSVRHIGIALPVSSDTLKGIVRHHLPQQHKFWRKDINIDDDYDGSKLFTTIPGACSIILGSTHTDRHDVIDFLVERHVFYRIRSGNAQKIRHVALDDSCGALLGYSMLS